MPADVSKYASTLAVLIAALVLVMIAALFTGGAVQIAAIVVLVLLVGALGALVGTQISRQRRDAQG